MACRFGALSDPIAALEHAPRNPWRDYGSLMRKDILTSWPGVSTSAKDGVAGQVAVAGGCRAAGPAGGVSRPATARLCVLTRGGGLGGAGSVGRFCLGRGPVGGSGACA